MPCRPKDRAAPTARLSYRITQIRVADLLGALSIVADLGYGFPAEEAMRACLMGTSLARAMGLPEWEVADTFYTSLLVHVGCVTFAHEVSAIFGDEHRANRAAARTNLADPKDIVGTMVPEATRGMAPLPRIQVAAFMLTRGLAFGQRYDTNNCEVARATARRIGLREGVRAALYEVHEWWKRTGSPPGTRGGGDRPSGTHRSSGHRRRPVSPPGRDRAGGGGAA